LGLTMTYASVFQMLRGSVVIFTGLLSVVFLKRKLFLFHWIGMGFVLVGLAIVGLSSALGGSDGSNAPNAVLGDILVIVAQLIVSVQMVVEEKFIGGYNVPALQCVGLEGTFGFIMTSFLLVILYFIPGSSAGDHAENTPDAFVQMYNSWLITFATFGNVVSIAFFNFFGISVTKHVNATTRMVLDSIRTFIIWGVSLAVGWQEFQYLQIIGFVMLLLGTAIYNKLLRLPCLPPPEDTAQLLETVVEDDADLSPSINRRMSSDNNVMDENGPLHPEELNSSPQDK